VDVLTVDEEREEEKGGDQGARPGGDRVQESRGPGHGGGPEEGDAGLLMALAGVVAWYCSSVSSEEGVGGITFSDLVMG
jgi:hypothetical protein